MVIPIGGNFQRQLYYLSPNCYDGFMVCYCRLISILNYSEIDDDTSTEEHHEPKIDWIADIDYINKTKFISGPSDNIKNKRNFQLGIPCYLWDLPILNDEIYMEQNVSNSVNLFLTKCTEKDHLLVLGKKHYLRILQYQDNPTSDRYVYMYLREIETCTFESHKLALKTVPKDKLACEICSSKRGFFFEFPSKECNEKNVVHINQFSL